MYNYTIMSDILLATACLVVTEDSELIYSRLQVTSCHYTNSLVTELKFLTLISKFPFRYVPEPCESISYPHIVFQSHLDLSSTCLPRDFPTKFPYIFLLLQIQINLIILANIYILLIFCHSYCN